MDAHFCHALLLTSTCWQTAALPCFRQVARFIVCGALPDRSTLPVPSDAHTVHVHTAVHTAPPRHQTTDVVLKRTRTVPSHLNCKPHQRPTHTYKTSVTLAKTNNDRIKPRYINYRNRKREDWTSCTAMSLSGLHRYLQHNVRTQNTRVGRSVMKGWSRGSDIHAYAVAYFKDAYRSPSFNADRLASAACQDLVNTKVLSLHQTAGYRSFSKRSDCLIYIHSRSPSSSARLRSGLRWS